MEQVDTFKHKTESVSDPTQGLTPKRKFYAYIPCNIHILCNACKHKMHPIISGVYFW